MRVAFGNNCVQLILYLFINYAACLLSTSGLEPQTTSIDAGPAEFWLSGLALEKKGDYQQSHFDGRPQENQPETVIRQDRRHGHNRRHRRHHNQKHRFNEHNHRLGPANEASKTTAEPDEVVGGGQNIGKHGSRLDGDNVVPMDNINQQSDEDEKTNPLIESVAIARAASSDGPQKDDNNNNSGSPLEGQYLSEDEQGGSDEDDDDDGDDNQEEGEKQNNNNNDNDDSNAKNIKPVQSGQSDRHEGGRLSIETIHSTGNWTDRDQQPLVVHADAPRQLQHKHKGSSWCHTNCNINDGRQLSGGGGGGGRRRRRPRRLLGRHQRQDRSKIVCASDGRFYKSMCELRRFACLNDVHLFKRPLSHCSMGSQTINYNEHELKLASSTTTTSPNNSDGDTGQEDASRRATISSSSSFSSSRNDDEANNNNNNNNNNSNNNNNNNNNNSHNNNRSAAGAAAAGPAGAAGSGSGDSNRQRKRLQDDKVRFIELKRRCNKAEFEAFKLALLREFAGQAEPMFRYFDTNNDGYIEAHELWPRLEVVAPSTGLAEGAHHQRDNGTIGGQNNEPAPIGSKYYARFWENHFSRCQSTSSSDDHHLADYHYHAADGCWYFVDFAFEPYFPWGPCSLSHLMLFELPGPNYKFDYNQFERVFSSNNGGAHHQDRPNQEANRDHMIEEVLRETYLSLALGESKLLDCLPSNYLSPDDRVNHINNNTNKNTTTNNNAWELFDVLDDAGGVGGDSNGNNNNNNNNNDNDNNYANDVETNEGESMQGQQPMRCSWTRYNSPMESVGDAHISIVGTPRAERIPPNSPPNLTRNSLPNLDGQPKLMLREAQLYLSGHYKCTCTRAKLNTIISHSYRVQVLGIQQTTTTTAEPKVTVRPSRQWSLASSRVSFECQHDFIDTRFGPRHQLPQDGRPSTATTATTTTTTTTAIQQNFPHDFSMGAADGQASSQFGLKINWLKNDQELVVDNKIYKEPAAINETKPIAGVQPIVEPSFSPSASSDFIQDDEADVYANPAPPSTHHHVNLSPSSGRASISMASTRLALESLQLNDTGEFVCIVNVPLANNNINEGPASVGGKGFGSLLVQDDQPRAFGQSTLLGDTHQASEKETHLWMFHDNGISVFRLENDDGQEMELLREINGHSLVSPEVDGNWNQLTLCGGLNQEQVVICEWSDNALYVNVPLASSGSSDGIPTRNYNNDSNSNSNNSQHEYNKIKSFGQKAAQQKYIYVGQPNLNRVIVMDGLKFEIVGIINTEPQPRKLFAARPNKIHLSKWVRRRLSPIANARWLAAIGSHAHELQLTPADSQVNSVREPAREEVVVKENNWSGRPVQGEEDEHEDQQQVARQFVKRAITIRDTSALGDARKRTRQARGPPPVTGLPGQMPSKLIQHDIWLLCYGQPLVVSPSDDDHLDEPSIGEVDLSTNSSSSSSSSSSMMMNLISDKPAPRDDSAASGPAGGGPIQPFTPRLPHSGPLAWSMGVWPAASVTAREASLRNRKSVQIIQSTFFPRFLDNDARDSVHGHWADHQTEPINLDTANGTQQHSNQHQHQQQQHHQKRADISSVAKFKRVTVLTTHYVFAGSILGGPSVMRPAASGRARRGAPSGLNTSNQVPRYHQRQRYLNRAQFDLIQDLTVPVKPYTLVEERRYKQHHAYVSHYDEQRLYRVSMDEYRYDRQIDLQDCDPVNLVAAAHGLLIIQCRARITHNLIGQLILDELTNARVQFNANIRAQEAHLSPDHRYLVSIYTNVTTRSATGQPVESTAGSPDPREDKQTQRRQSVIYVQLVSVEGLKLQYEIKTSLDISQCSFVWKEGYYAAIFVSTNRQEQQSEVLSLRLADGRLELMVRVPGLITTSRHKEVLNVLPELQIAALSTNQGTYIIDIQENRVTQTLHHRQSIPTLLWVNDKN